MTLSEIGRNLYLINNKITQVCTLYQKDKSKINLVAVSKTKPVEKIIEAINAGCAIFGENYINEAQEKWPEILQNNPNVKLHFIGHLQSNKAKIAVELFDCIQTLDSEKLAKALAKEIKKQNKSPEIFVQVNISEEPQKGGILPADLDDFLKITQELELNVTGLMCIPKSDEAAAPYFALLKKLAQKSNLKNLSMGMTSDFEDAIALDANYIRIGTAIFGKRQ